MGGRMEEWGQTLLRGEEWGPEEWYIYVELKQLIQTDNDLPQISTRRTKRLRPTP